MGDDGRYSAQVDLQTMHDLREGLTLTKGWLEALFRGWDHFEDAQKREMVAAALLGANRLAYLLERIDGRPIEELPHERMAEEFLKLVER